MKNLIFLAITFALILGGCTHQPRPIPRRTAYPRIETLPDSSITHTLGSLAVQINAAATVSSPKDGWMDVRYPLYGAVLHLTSTPYKTLKKRARILENRLERMRLNLGDAPARQLKFTNAHGFECLLLTAESGTTPLQFIATGPDEIVSGVVVFSGPTSPADSIAPVISELDNEMIAILRNLRHAD